MNHPNDSTFYSVRTRIWKQSI